MVNAVKVYKGDFADASLVTHDVSKVDIQAAPVLNDEQEQESEQTESNLQKETNEVETNNSNRESNEVHQSNDGNSRHDVNTNSTQNNSSYNNHINQYDGNIDTNNNTTTSNVQAYSVSSDLPTTGSYNEPMDPFTPIYSISIGLLMISAVLIKKSGILD